MHERLDAGLDQVLDDLHLLLDVDLALGRLHLQVDAEPIGRLLRAAAHVDEERVVQRLEHERHGRLSSRVAGPRLQAGARLHEMRPVHRQRHCNRVISITSARSSVHVRAMLPFQDRVEQHGDDDHAADDDLLEERRDAQQVEAVAQHAHDQRADQRAAERAFAAHQAGAADHGGGDRVELVVDAGDRLRRVEPRGQHDRGNRAHQPRHAVDHRLVEADRDARQARRFFVAADRVDVAAERRPREHEMRGGVDDRHRDHRRRHEADAAGREHAKRRRRTRRPAVLR